MKSPLHPGRGLPVATVCSKFVPLPFTAREHLARLRRGSETQPRIRVERDHNIHAR
jgi:hypothetical protein